MLDGVEVEPALDDEPLQQEPPQVGVDGEAVPRERAVEQPGHHVELRVGRGGSHERPGVGELVVAAGRGRHGVAVQRIGEAHEVVGAVLGSGELVDGRLQLAQHALHHADVALAADAGEHEGEEVPRRGLGVARHVPGRAPDEGAWEGVDEVSDVLGRREP